MNYKLYIYLSTLVTSVVLYSLTPATLMSPGKDETRVYGYLYIYIYIYIKIWKPFNDVLDKEKLVLKTH